jgi:hypothetical protein
LPLFAFAAQAQTAAPADTAAPAAPPAASTAPLVQPHRAARQSMQQRFDAANTSHDGKLTLEQAKAGMPRVARHFSAIDKDSKGYVTLDEIHEYNSAQHKAHQHHAG